MILIDTDFIKDLKRHKFNSKDKGQVLDAICKLLENPDSGRGIRKKGNDFYFDAIGKKWQLHFDKLNGDIHLIDIWDHNMGANYQTTEKTRNSHSTKKTNVAISPPGTGFSSRDFDTLNLAFKAQDEIGIKDYFKKICEQIFPKFESLAQKVSNRLNADLGVKLFGHKAEMADILNHPVVWLAFINAEDGYYEHHAQLTFHLGIGDCIHKTTNHQYPHFCIKLAVFFDKIDNKKFYRNFENYPDKIRKYAKKKLDGSYKMRFYQTRGGRPYKEFPVHMKEAKYSEVKNLMSPESIAKGFYGFSISKEYPYREGSNAENFSNLTWVEGEIVNEFSNLMYLYFMFSEHDPLQKIEDYKKWKIPFDDKKSSAQNRLKRGG
jgi:uncharacterized protein YktB (UPF0637 family)